MRDSGVARTARQAIAVRAVCRPVCSALAMSLALRIDRCRRPVGGGGDEVVVGCLYRREQDGLIGELVTVSFGGQHSLNYRPEVRAHGAPRLGSALVI
jgi:hypothetical protein